MTEPKGEADMTAQRLYLDRPRSGFCTSLSPTMPGCCLTISNDGRDLRPEPNAG